MTKEKKLAILDDAKDRVYEVLATTDGNDWDSLANVVNAIHNLMMLRCDVMDAELDSPNVYNCAKEFVQTRTDDGRPEDPENCVDAVKEVNFHSDHVEVVFKDKEEQAEPAAVSAPEELVPEVVPAPVPVQVTKEEVRKRLLTLDKPKIVEALNAIGYTKLSEVPSEKYAELLERAGV